MEYITLRNGVKIPALGYGVYMVEPDECERCVSDALIAGYRAIDTAQCYKNEAEVGAAIVKSGIPRNEIFLTTKIWIDRYEDAKASVMESLKKLQTDYLDLCLLHKPYGDCYGAYRAMEDLYDEGIIRAIGVSNFDADRMVDIALFNRIAPMINQVEMHPFYQRRDIAEWAAKLGIVLEAWGPLGHGLKEFSAHPALCALAEKYHKTYAQIILRWDFQHGVVTIPKSVHPERVASNIDIFDFELSAEEMTVIDNMDKNESSSGGYHNDPEVVEWYAQRVGRA